MKCIEIIDVNWDYIGPLILKDNIPYQIMMHEGRAVFEEEEWHFEFEIRDHVGNLRMLFAAKNDTLRKIQSSDYSPFGLAINPRVFGPKEDMYAFQGHESQPDFGLRRIGTPAGRCINPTTGRFDAVDALSENTPSLTGYRAMFNNPVNVIDPTGNTEFTGDIEFSDGYRTISTRAATSAVLLSGTYNDPIFGKKTGKFLGHYNDSDFKGEIMLMDETTHEVLTEGLAVVLSPEMADKYGQLLSEYVANDFDFASQNDRNFLSSIFTSLIDQANYEGLIDYNSSQLEGGKFEIGNDWGIANYYEGLNGDQITANIHPVSLSEYKANQFSGGIQSLFYIHHSGDAINVLGVHEPLHRYFPGNANHKTIDSLVRINRAYHIASDAYKSNVANRKY